MNSNLGFLASLWSIYLPVSQSALLNQKSSPHVAPIKVLKFQEIIMHVYKAKNDCANNTDAKEG